MHYKAWITNLPEYKPAKLVKKPLGQVIKLSSNENVLGPSPRALEALATAMHNLHRYPDSTAETLRQALAEHAHLSADHVICGNGSDELVLLLCLAFLREQDEAVMADGAFISYLLRTQVMGGKAIQVPLKDYTHDLAAMADAITPQTRLIFVCNPNNPTGTSNGEDEVQAFLERVPEDVLIVMDEAYGEYATRKDYPDLLPAIRNGRKNLILLRTFAKIYGLAGLRLGYGYAHPEVIDYLHKVRPVFNVNALSQAVGPAALKDVVHVARSRSHAEASRRFFRQELTALGREPLPSETNFLAVDVGDDAAVTEALFQRGFMVTPLTGWGLPGFIRFSFGTEEENAQFLAALRDIIAA
jgi:histidinol-phosphate aminotransferase